VTKIVAKSVRHWLLTSQQYKHEAPASESFAAIENFCLRFVLVFVLSIRNPKRNRGIKFGPCIRMDSADRRRPDGVNYVLVIGYAFPAKTAPQS
jgi:hypothetical protein